MKTKHLPILAAALLSMAVSSCNNGSDPEIYTTMVTVDFTLPSEVYNQEGYWKDVYNPEATYFAIQPWTAFNHKAEVTEYDGVEYKSFTGFCPTRVNDTSDHSGDDWTLFQFSAAAPTYGDGYLIAHWDVREDERTPLAERSCLIECFGRTFIPVSVRVTNTSYAYWVMKNGSAFSEPFDSQDYLYLDIYAVKDGKAVLGYSFPLAENGSIVNTWQQIDLSTFGEVQQIYFTMRSSDTGDWGMNTPAYFAIDNLQMLF